MSAMMTVLPPLGAAVIRALGVTWRIDVHGREHVDAARRDGGPLVFAFWHGRLLPLSYLHRDEGARVLASEHKDGELLGRVIERLGFGHVRGSSTRGGTKAILSMTDAVREGFDVALTVDGPRGPRFEAKPGAIEVAKLTGAPIIPVTTASRRHKTFASWDAFELPWPFTRVRIEYAEAIRVPRDADGEVFESVRRALDASLRRITESCDREVRR